MKPTFSNCGGVAVSGHIGTGGAAMPSQWRSIMAANFSKLGRRCQRSEARHWSKNFLAGYSAQEKPPFRTMGRHCSGGWDATIPVHGKPVTADRWDVEAAV